MLAWMKTHWKRALLIGAAVLVVLLVTVRNMQPEEIDAIQLEKQDLLATLTVTGEVEAKETAKLTAPVASRVERIHVEEGDVVHLHQPLVVLRQDEMQAQLLEAQAQWAQMVANWERTQMGTRTEELARVGQQVQEATFLVEASRRAYDRARSNYTQQQNRQRRFASLHAQGGMSEQEWEQQLQDTQGAYADLQQAEASISVAQSRLLQAKAQLLAAQRGPVHPERKASKAAADAARKRVQEMEAKVHDQTIRSPFEGVVVQRSLSPGDMAAPGTPILEVAQTSRLELTTDVQEVDLSRLHVGAEALVVLDAYPKTPLKAKVTRVGSQVNPDNGTVDVIVNFLAYEATRLSGPVLPGMTADVTVLTERLTQKMVVPALSTVQNGTQAYVYRFHGNRIEKVPVSVRRVSLEHVEILSGLNPGDWVVYDASKKEAASVYLGGKAKTPRPVQLDAATGAKDFNMPAAFSKGMPGG